MAAVIDLVFGFRTALASGKLDEDDLELVGVSPRSIAGVEGDCFELRAKAQMDEPEAEICFSKEDILLYLRSWSGPETVVLEATSVRTDVSDADFSPPFPVVNR